MMADNPILYLTLCLFQFFFLIAHFVSFWYLFVELCCISMFSYFFVFVCLLNCLWVCVYLIVFCLFSCLFVYFFLFLLVSLFLFVFLFICLFTKLLVSLLVFCWFSCLFVFVFVVCLFVFFVCLVDGLFVCLFVSLFVFQFHGCIPVQLSPIFVLSRQDGKSNNGISYVTRAATHLLDPRGSEFTASFVGRLVTSLIRKVSLMKRVI